MDFVVLGLGSNMTYAPGRNMPPECSGQDGQQLLQPVQILEKACGDLATVLTGLRLSSVYTSAAMYVTDQNDFFNMAAAGFFSGSPEQLLEQIHAIEEKWGRNRLQEIRNGSRTLDIDIELFGNQTVCTADLRIPHEKMTERAFVLIPVLEIMRKSAESLNRDFYERCLERLPDQNVRLYRPPFISGA